MRLVFWSCLILVLVTAVCLCGACKKSGAAATLDKAPLSKEEALRKAEEVMGKGPAGMAKGMNKAAPGKSGQ